MTEPIISQSVARALHLAAQGMLNPPRARATRADVRAAIRRMGMLQIDTISVVARSPYFVLWSRLGDYDPAWLDDLLVAGSLFEYWAHEACFIPVEDYGLYRHRMLDPGALGWKFAGAWMAAHPDAVAHVLDHIRRHGPTRSADFGRVDAKAHRRAGVFDLKAVWLEPGVRVSARLVRDLAGAALRCARWHGCAQLALGRTEPQALAAPLLAALKPADGLF